MEKATKTPVCDIARCLFFSHWHWVNKCTGTKRCRPSLLDTFKPGRLFSSTPISLPLISLPLLSLYLILSRLAGGAEARTAAPASQARGGARHACGLGRILAAAATAGAGRRRHRGGVRGPHREREGRTAAAVVKLLYGLHGGRREEQAALGEKEAGTQTSSAHRSPARGGLYLSLLRPPSSPPRRGCSSLASPRALRLPTSLPPPRVLRRGASGSL